jgi:hypothetical protein
MPFCNSLAESISGGLPRCNTITKVAKGAVGMVCCTGSDAPGAMAMHWFRSRSRWGSYLALFALAFQIALTFGHAIGHSLEPEKNRVHPIKIHSLFLQ